MDSSRLDAPLAPNDRGGVAAPPRTRWRAVSTCSFRRCAAYMPFMHSEDLADQERSVALFATMRDDPDSLRAARQHRDIIARFGRFPHRNAILGRATTGEEAAFLADPGAAF